ncbi:hypothetical protein [Clostridium omnivorum]|uniref:Uncharacterized protein n=1 Tax=Clostridium omnivorum TaxID=1604902 RepID=A0ABQ5N297_9CLOT|nr:hypothetical protein [Clostridium sp. E14]GLC29315.1 hypothetical protein bsdE14_07250 [Clostridium sp. E14]
MKQHLFGDQLKEINYEERIILLSHVTGLNSEYMKEEYAKGIKDEEGMLRALGFEVKIGELIELIYNYTRQFPSPIVSQGSFAVHISFDDGKGNKIEYKSGTHMAYIDALYEIVKNLLNEKYIE